MLRIIVFLILPVFILSGCYAFKKTGLVIQRENTVTLKNQDPYTKDFGLIKAGQVIGHSFVIKNDSKIILNIKNVNSSCGCTVSKVNKKTLKPKESTEMEVRFNSKGYSGPVQQFVYVNTDSLENPVVKYIIKAEVEK